MNRRWFVPEDNVEPGLSDEELFAEVADPEYTVQVGSEYYRGMSYTKAKQCAQDGITAYLIELYDGECRDFYEGWERLRQELTIRISPEIPRFDALEYAMNKWRWILGDESVKKPWELYRRDWMRTLEEHGV